MFRLLLFAFLSDCVDIFVSVSRGGAINQRGYIVTGILRHRSHFGSRYKLGCCGHASLFGGVASGPSECQYLFLSVSVSFSVCLCSRIAWGSDRDSDRNASGSVRRSISNALQPTSAPRTQYMKALATCKKSHLLPRRVHRIWQCAKPEQCLRNPEQAQGCTSPRKINATSKSPVGDISVVTLIRTDTTLDHGQKAEKV